MVNPLMHYVEKWGKKFYKPYGVHLARFLCMFGHFSTLCMKGFICIRRVTPFYVTFRMKFTDENRNDIR